MIEVEIQKLTAAIETLTKVVQEMSRPTLVVTNGTPTKVTTLEEAEKSYREDDAARMALQVERDRRQAELDQQMADVYKAEQAKTKRKAKVTPENIEDAMAASYEHAIEKNTAAIARMKAKVTPEETKALVEASKGASEWVPPTATDLSGAPEPEVVSDLTENDLKTLAMEIARADSSARNIILSILGEHGSKTITQLDAKHYRAVHARFLSLAHDIAKEGEEV